jgi:protein SCO1/2
MAGSSKISPFNIILLVCALGAIGIAMMMNTHKKPIRILPIYGPSEYDAKLKDTIYHKVFNFKLTDQMGQTVTLDSFKNKVFVANFFYATCPGICKKMNYELENATKAFAGNPKVKFLSYTVDPVRDSVPVLAQYAKLHDAVPYQWYFLTGSKDSIYHLARKSYYASVDTADGRNFVHTENMVLVDSKRQLRGIYHGTDSADVARMVKDINLLLQEESQQQ